MNIKDLKPGTVVKVRPKPRFGVNHTIECRVAFADQSDAVVLKPVRNIWGFLYLTEDDIEDLGVPSSITLDNLEVGQIVKVQLNKGDTDKLYTCEVVRDAGQKILVTKPEREFGYIHPSDVASLSTVPDKPDSKPEPELGPKYDEGKVDWTLLPMFAVEEVAKVMGFGASKYYRDSWRKVPEYKRRYIAAAYRHIMDYFFRRVTPDGESGLHHLAHAACCILFVLEMDLLVETEDDGPK